MKYLKILLGLKSIFLRIRTRTAQLKESIESCRLAAEDARAEYNFQRRKLVELESRLTALESRQSEISSHKS